MTEVEVDGALKYDHADLVHTGTGPNTVSLNTASLFLVINLEEREELIVSESIDSVQFIAFLWLWFI